MKFFSQFLRESILDPEQATVSPQVFDLDGDPKLKSDVRDLILAGMSKIFQVAPVIDYTLIGSILTRRYADDADVDVNVLIGSENQNQYEAAKQAAIDASGHLIPGTKHPINYHVLSDKQDFDNANDSADGVFDISANKFIKKPTDRPFHVEKYFAAFKDVVSKIDVLKDDLKDDLIDYSSIKSFSKDDLSNLKSMLQDALDDIESDAKGLADLHSKIVADRNTGFAKPLSASDIREYGTKNRLPGNVVYKLLERYHYLNFLKKIDAFLDDGKISDAEAEKLLDIVL